MSVADIQMPLQPGERAPEFMLPAVHREGMISSADYLGKKPVLLALFRGLWCPFCRRAIAQLGTARTKLEALGVETLGVVATTVENARLYYKFRPTKLPLAADAAMTTHQAFRLPKPQITPDFLRGLETVQTNANGELPEALPLTQVSDALDARDGFKPTGTDLAEKERQYPQLEGQFLVDRAGIIRWAYVECAKDGLAGVGQHPSSDELVVAARAVSS